ncbi:MAG TPA: PDZ domain-containing protein [Dokdonella sp.]
MRASVLALLAGLPLAAAAAPPQLLQAPTLSRTAVVFAYANDLWIAPRDGGDAHVLVHAADRAGTAHFSPDGTQVAYSARVDGNVDVYVVAAAGGEPRRLTSHPGDDVAVGWTPDGRRVLFASHRDAANDSGKLYTVALDGGPQEALPLARAERGAYSPDAASIAYEPDFQWEPDWRGYRGGQTTPIWIARLADASVTPIPRDNSNDRDPMWIGDTVYFVSDRDGPATLYAYDTNSRRVTRVLDNDGFPIDSASAGPGAIVYAQMGVLHVFDLATRVEHALEVRVAADGSRLAPRFESVGKRIENAALSPTGARAVFEAHGEILTVPAEKGDVRDLTRTSDVAERDPAWSPDGKSIAYFSDASGEYALHVRGQDGLGVPRTIALGEPPSFFYSPVWSPDSSHVAYRDKRLNLWLVDLARPVPQKVDSDRYDTPLHEFDPAWSPDGRWLAYTKQLPNHLRAVFVYSLASRKATQVTDGMSDCLYPNFDKNGKYLYFAASTDVGLSPGWLDMTSDAHPVTRSVYVAVLRKDLPSPLAPESDEDKGAPPPGAKPKDDEAEKNGAKEPAAAAAVAIDFDGILQRTLALPIPAENYVGLAAGKSGELFALQADQVAREDAPFTVQKFALDKRKTDKLLDGVTRFVVSFDGAKMLYARGDDWFIAKTDAAPKAGEGKIATDAMRVEVDPRREWAQMYREVWRIERDFFYDPHFHGLDLAAAERRFEPFLAGVASREDLDVLFRRMLAYVSVGHMFVRGPHDEAAHVAPGLLGADYATDHGRYRFAKIYDGENWNPDLRAPLTQPGVVVEAGEYLLAVDGRELHASDDVYAFFAGTAERQTVLRVAADAAGARARDVTVVPVKDEHGLRHRAWVEANRRKVDQLSGGRLAYVHLPDTHAGGFTSFNRYFFAQTDKQGVVVDERYNHGGQLADYVVDYLQRAPMTRIYTREGEPYTEPTQAIFGPKAMLINQFSGSGGDALPWYFKRMGIGPLIGKRTWGGLVGIGGYPPLVDGGTVTAPRWALAGLHGDWEVENRGIAPDLDVEDDPRAERDGHDPQLERAVEYLMKQLAEHPAPSYPTPPYPDFKPTLPRQP